MGEFVGEMLWKGVFFLGGFLGWDADCFDSSIYGLVLNPNLKFLGPVTPIGGTALIAGWIALAVATRGRIALRS